MQKGTLLRKIYLYLFSLVGLVLLVIGCVNFVNMGLKAWVFTSAEQQQKIEFERPIEPAEFVKEMPLEVATGAKVKVELTESQVSQLNNLITNYEQWEERQGEFDFVKSSRHRSAAMNLALIIIGLPLYLIHWLIIRKEKSVS